MADIAWDVPGPHIRPWVVGPEHIDLMQHVNNVMYLQWMEDTAWDHSTALGLGPAQYEALGHGMVVSEHRLRYLQATRLGETLWLGTWLGAIDRLTMTRHYQFVRASDGQTVFRAETRFVCVDIAQGKVRRMPADFQRIYGDAVVPTPAA